MVKLGVIGFSEGNGHPFSFSSIINGYSKEEFKKTGWDVIYNYLEKRDTFDFGFEGVKITHAWTQHFEVTQCLCKACNIPYPIKEFEDMISEVDAVLIARDDYASHLKLAKPFLQRDKHVFIDKPLTLEIDELKFYQPFLQSGLLMSCSGFRYAKELDEFRFGVKDFGKMKLIQGVIVNDWEKYGVHLLDGLVPFLQNEPVSVCAHKANHSAIVIEMSDNSLLQISTLGQTKRIFKLNIFGEDKHYACNITDNFTMFRRMLWHFIQSVTTKIPPIPIDDTNKVIKLLIAGRTALNNGRKVFLDEFKL